MSIQSKKFKELINNGCLEKNENLSKKINNNRYNKSRNMIISDLVISQTKTGNGVIRYGNFKNLMNAKEINNEVISNLINDIKEQRNINTNRNDYVYINNLINAYSENYCVVTTNNDVDINDSKYDYHTFYENYKELVSLLQKNNYNQNNCGFGINK